MDRPPIDKNLDANVFNDFYYLKAELVAFCKQEQLQTTGSKKELNDRIVHYLKTGEKIKVKKTSQRVKVDKQLTLDDKIGSNFVCSQIHREFYKKEIGMSFSFNVKFQKWLKQNASKTYRESIQVYYQILDEKKVSKSKIDKQFEYNLYIRDFFSDNTNKSLDEAIKCWKHKKSLTGHNRYEEEDLIALKAK